MKKFSLVMALMLLFCVAFMGCGEEKLIDNNSVNIAIEVIDYDGKELLRSEVVADKDITILDVLKSNKDYDVQLNGTFVVSISDSLVDPNWALMFYIDNKMSPLGVSEVKVEEGKTYSFKVECWNTQASGYGAFDDIDILVDKTIYTYMQKGYFDSLYNRRTTFQDGDYWLDISNNMMRDYNYSERMFFARSNDKVSESIEGIDFATLSGADWGKSFYYLRAQGADFTEYRTAYTNYINSLDSATYYYNAYTSPFELGFARVFVSDNPVIDTIMGNTAFSKDMQWGADGALWQNTSLSAFKDMPQEELDFFTAQPDWATASDWSNSLTTAMALGLYASNNINIRNVQSELEKDTIEILFESCYDSESGLLLLDKTKDITAEENRPVSQMYTYLMAYKIQRDKAVGVNIFE